MFLIVLNLEDVLTRSRSSRKVLYVSEKHPGANNHNSFEMFIKQSYKVESLFSKISILKTIKTSNKVFQIKHVLKYSKWSKNINKCFCGLVSLKIRL